MKKQLNNLLFLSACTVAMLLLTASATPERAGINQPSWGFFAHKRINRLAVLTLPPEMMVFFKKNIDFISDHAVDPDMRRYATRLEGARHFIDLDQYGTPPFPLLPRNWSDALIQHTDIRVIDTRGDTLLLVSHRDTMTPVMRQEYRRWFQQSVTPVFYSGKEEINPDSVFRFFSEWGRLDTQPKNAFFQEFISGHGILPWNLQHFQQKLTTAFQERNTRKILKYSAEIGHYIGDAHVPLHTCSNYNGQKTGQHGIHGFWESRIPELFADESYDYFVGKPSYIENTRDWFWKCALDSHNMVDSVLSFEKKLRESFPADRQMCPDMRKGVMGIHPCREFASAYQEALDGMVERRMRAAIIAVSSAWYTAWVDAGQPDLSGLDAGAPDQQELEEDQSVRNAFALGKILGRTEDH
ncbi:MAG: zinc dependent phospholipase C family protein [Bacteroidota bacterium]